MSQERLVKIKCAETNEVIYTRRNKKTSDKKLELKKYSPKKRTHLVFKEMKK
jgi:ribosomal protein L33